MIFFVILFSLLSLGLAAPSPDAYASDYGYYAPPQPLTSVHYAAPQPLPSSQFHAQDDVGQYNYGYQGDTSAKEEFKTADGVVRGSYSYVDANGIVQTTNYIADALGFRVAATNLPVHVVDDANAAVAVEAAVAAAPVEVAAATPVVAAAPATPAVVSTYGQGSPYGVYGYGGVVRPNPTVDYAYLPYATGYNYHQVPTQYVSTYGQSIQENPIVQVAPVAAPAPVAYTSAQVSPVAAPAPVAYTSAQVAPVAAPAPVVYTTAQAAPAVVPVVQGPTHVDQSQYHAQDEFGQYSFGYNDPNSIRQEVKTADGVIRGAYRYVDADGKIQTVEYIADAGGFRVAATNLPVHDVGVVVDTPEVAAAKANHAIATANAYIAAAQSANVEVEGFVVSPAEPVAAAQSAPVEVIAVEGSGEEVAAEEPSVYAAPPLPIAPVVAPAPAPVAAPAPVVYQTPVAAPAPVVYHTPVVAPAPVAYQPAVAAPVVHAAPVVPASQYHAQDDIGQYSFGYSDQNSIKQELRSADGVVRGSYSYVDSNGIIQTVNYIADALGFRVGATNLPVHNVDAPVAAVAAAPVEVAAAPVEVAATPVAAPVASSYYAPAIAPQVSYSYLPYAANYAYNSQHYAHTVPYVAPVAASAPVEVAAAAAAAPVAVAAAAPVPIFTGTPVDAVNSQFHAQDDIGQYNYGFSNPTQTKEEIKTADGVTRGSYSYIDANGLVQTVNYISDAMGFRVAATNLPVHHVEGAAPAAAAVEEAPAAAAGYSIISPSVNYAYLPYATNYGYHHTVPAAVAQAA